MRLFRFRGLHLQAPVQVQYTYSVRPDMLRLYRMFHEKKKTKHDTVTIEYNKQKIELANDDNWFLQMITPYLEKYLGVASFWKKRRQNLKRIIRQHRQERQKTGECDT